MQKHTYRSWRWTILSVAFLLGVMWLSWPREAPSVDVTPDNASDVAREEGAPLCGTPSIGPLREASTEEEADPVPADARSEDAPTVTPEGDTEESKFEYFTATIEGRVVDSTGALISGAVLMGVDSLFERFPSLREMDDGMPRPPPADHGRPEEWGATDETGFYRIELRLEVDRGITELDISLFATLHDWSARSDERYFAPLRAGETVTHDFEIELPGAVTGRMVDERGAPLEGIRFTMGLAIGLGPGFTLRTDSSGRFEAKKIPAGAYRVALITREWRLASDALPFAVKSGETLELLDDIVLKRVTSIRITLTCDQDPAPWAGARDKSFMAVVWLYTKDENELSLSETVESDGTITLYDLPAEGVTDVRVEVPGFEPTGWSALYLREGEVNEVSFALIGKD